MARFLAGVVSALLLVAAGVFLWKGLATGNAMAPLPAPAVGTATALTSTAAPDLPPPQATEQTREQKRFSRYDHNKDGRIDRDEYLALRRKNFGKLDTNGDGKLSFEEYAAKAELKFGTADADHSGTLDPTEFATTRVVRKTKPRCPPGQAAPVAAQPAGDDEG